MSIPDPRLPTRERNTRVVLLVAVTLAFVAIILPFYGAVMWGAIIGLLFMPLQRRLERRLKGRANSAAAITLLIVVLIVILPLILLLGSLAREGAHLAQSVQAGQIDFGHYLQQILGLLPQPVVELLQRYDLADIESIQARLAEGAGRVSQFFASQAIDIGQNTMNLLIGFCVALYIAFFMLRDGRALAASIHAALPLPDDDKRKLARKFTTVVRATVKGNVVVAAVQGMLGGLAFWVLGVRGALLWGTVMAFLSLLPAVGATLVWLPVALYLLAVGQLWQGTALIFWCVFVIGLVDNLLRPVLVGKDTKLPDWLVLVSTIGGMALFGINGFVIGPVIAAMFIAVWGLASGTDGEGGAPPAR